MEMEEKVRSLAFGGGGETELHPIVIGILILAFVFIFFKNQRSYILPFILLVTFLLPISQRISVLGLNFMVMRILILMGWAWIIIRADQYSFKLNNMDKCFIAWVSSNIIFYTVLWQDFGAFINRLGFALDSLGMYFLSRKMIREYQDIKNIFITYAVISVLIAFCMINEHVSKENVFAIFGGVSEFSIIRGDRLRAQGPFLHALLAGSFAASILPCIVSLWVNKGSSRYLVIVGSIAAIAMVFLTSSSGPIFMLFAGIFALSLWPLRRILAFIYLSAIVCVIFAHAIMKAPVWALLARIPLIEGSTGHHRYMLIDNFISRFDEWWFTGTRDYGNWGWMTWDVINQYISQGLNGGIITLSLFLIVLIIAFQYVGRRMKLLEGHRKMQFVCWSVGASAFANSVGFFGIAYFDQTIIMWYVLLAIISSMETWAQENIIDAETIDHFQLPQSL